MRIIRHTPTKVLLEWALDEGQWSRLRARHPSDAYALRELRVLCEDSVRLAVASGGRAAEVLRERVE